MEGAAVPCGGLMGHQPCDSLALWAAPFMQPWPGALLWVLLWGCHLSVIHFVLGSKVQLPDKLHCLGFSHAIAILPAIALLVIFHDAWPLPMNLPPTPRHYLIMNMTAGYMIVDSLGFLLHCLRVKRSMLIYFTHHAGSLFGISGAYVTGTFANETVLTIFFLMLHAPVYYISRYLRSRGMVERADALKQLSSDIDALVAFLYGPPILVYVGRSKCHVFFKACGLFLAISNYLWVFMMQYKRFSRRRPASLSPSGGSSGGLGGLRRMMPVVGCMAAKMDLHPHHHTAPLEEEPVPEEEEPEPRAVVESAPAEAAGEADATAAIAHERRLMTTLAGTGSDASYCCKPRCRGSSKAARHGTTIMRETVVSQ